MLDEGACLLCGKPVAPSYAAYCSRECSTIDSSSSNSASVSAASSTHPSPMMPPADAGYPNADVPPLVRSHHRNRLSISSSSTLDSDDYVYGDQQRRPSITYSRRPSATNHRGTIPSIPLPLQLHQRTNSEASYEYMREHDPAYVFAKAMNDHPIFTTNSAIRTSSSSSAGSSSDEDHPTSADPRNQRTITGRARHSPRTLTNKKQHRVSLPAYFSRLSVEPTTVAVSGVSPSQGKGEREDASSVSDYDTPIQALAQSYPSPRSNPSSSSGIHTSAALLSGRAAAAARQQETPRGRGRDRRVRQGASRSRSRSPHDHAHTRTRTRKSHSRSLSHSFSRSRSPSLSASPILLKAQLQAVLKDPSAVPRAIATPPVDAFGLGLAHSLGERAIRVPGEHVAVPAPEPVVEEAPRGRRARGEDEVLPEGEERERGRSRIVVKRGSLVIQ